MEVNKENEKSRIPVLKHRTDTRLLHKQEDTPNIVSQSRDALKTLSHQNIENCLAGPSRAVGKLDTRFVTYRSNNEELDWKLEVFQDNRTKNKTAKSDIARSRKSNQYGPDASSHVKTTPALLPKTRTEASTLKKVKRSLKRTKPLGLFQVGSPVSAKAYHCSILSSSDIDRNICTQQFDCYLNGSYALDNLNYMLKSEKKGPGEPKIRKASRSCVINWIINVNGSNGNPAVVQLACWYLDYYLSSTWVPVNRLQVIAAACFWIANKIHAHNISSGRLVRYSGHAFIEKELVAEEKNILKKLKFQVLPVTPHEFVPYLSWCCDQPAARAVEAAAVFLCQCGIMIDKTLGVEYPSVIAAAAVKNALLLLRQNIWMDKLNACPIYKLAEKKASNLNGTCGQLREAVRVVSSVGYEYKAPLFKFSGPPHYISNKMVRAVNFKDILSLDTKGRNEDRKLN